MFHIQDNYDSWSLIKQLLTKMNLTGQVVRDIFHPKFFLGPSI